MKYDNIKLPKNYPHLTTKQVLTAEWINGIPLTNKQTLLDQNYDLTLIMKQYIKLFGRQIFEYGFIHSDPHPGNLLVRFDSKNKQQLVLIDHGLYITLSDSFRLQYCNLWRYLFLLNTKGIEQIGREWGYLLLIYLLQWCNYDPYYLVQKYKAMQMQMQIKMKMKIIVIYLIYSEIL